MKIFIPTRDRINAQFTWDNLSPDLRAATTLVCPAEEVEAHQKLGRNALARPPVRLSAVRQWLVDEACDGPDKGMSPIIMLDDDLAFFVRKDPSAYNLRPADVNWETSNIFDRLECLVLGEAPEGWGGPMKTKKVVHAGLSPRQGSNWLFPAEVVETTRMNAVHCILPAALRHYGIRYDDVDMMEDYHVTLSLFEKGENNFQIADASWDQCKGSGAPGGFSHYRTSERQAAAAHRLAELHPKTVKVVTKNQSSGSGAFSGVRTDVRVQWVQAYKKAGVTPTFVRGE